MLVERSKMAVLMVAFMTMIAGSADALDIRAVTTRPDMVSGGDVLIAVRSVQIAPHSSELVFSLNGAAKQPVFRKSAMPDLVYAYVDGLKTGENTLTVRTRGSDAKTLRLVNYPITGPIFSGPHVTPYNCETETSQLGKPLDADCSAQTRYSYYYRTNKGKFVALADAARYPDDMAYTTVEGVKVPYIVRVETGTINRAIYLIAVLSDPTKPTEANQIPMTWNGRLQYSFDGGCGSGRRQGSIAANYILDNVSLSRGFAVATSTLNAYRTACDDVLSAETAMMVKDYFTKRYGVPKVTIGHGGSGGAMQQNLIAQNYPGILDSIIPEHYFPDVQTLSHVSSDATLLAHYFDTRSATWNDAQKLAVTGFGMPGTFPQWASVEDRVSINARVCNKAIPAEQRYDAKTNPKGVRCTFLESMATYYGRDPKTGFARRPLDNVGIQYGLNALRSGVINVDQFLDLNENVGGYDMDGEFSAARSVADPVATRNGYATGRVWTGQGVSLPIVSLREYLDGGKGNVHTRFHDLEYRQRLIDGNKTAANQAVLMAPAPMSDEHSGFALDMMTQWLDRLGADTSTDPYGIKVVRARPAALKDGCWDSGGAWIDEAPTADGNSACNRLYPYYGLPRTVAGEPVTQNIVKCVLKPAAFADYQVDFTRAQKTRLRKIFPGGVCDYSKPGLYRAAWKGAWQTWGPAPESIAKP